MEISYSYWGVVIVLTFIGLPFVVRTLQPALEDLDPQIEEAAASLGAGRLQTFLRVILPSVLPALLTGFSLAFARALGEYGSVVFIASTSAGDADRADAHCFQAGTVRLRRGHGPGRNDAPGVVRVVADRQPASVVEPEIRAMRKQNPKDESQ